MVIERWFSHIVRVLYINIYDDMFEYNEFKIIADSEVRENEMLVTL